MGFGGVAKKEVIIAEDGNIKPELLRKTFIELTAKKAELDKTLKNHAELIEQNRKEFAEAITELRGKATLHEKHVQDTNSRLSEKEATLDALIAENRKQKESGIAEIIVLKDDLFSKLEKLHSVIDESTSALAKRNTEMQTLVDGLQGKTDSLSKFIADTKAEKLDDITEIKQIAGEVKAAKGNLDLSLDKHKEEIRKHKEDFDISLAEQKEGIKKLKDSLKEETGKVENIYNKYETRIKSHEKEMAAQLTLIENAKNDLIQKHSEFNTTLAKTLDEAAKERAEDKELISVRHTESAKQIADNIEALLVRHKGEIQKMKDGLVEETGNLHKVMSDSTEALLARHKEEIKNIKDGLVEEVSDLHEVHQTYIERIESHKKDMAAQLTLIENAKNDLIQKHNEFNITLAKTLDEADKGRARDHELMAIRHNEYAKQMSDSVAKINDILKQHQEARNKEAGEHAAALKVFNAASASLKAQIAEHASQRNQDKEAVSQTIGNLNGKIAELDNTIKLHKKLKAEETVQAQKSVEQIENIYGKSLGGIKDLVEQQTASVKEIINQYKDDLSKSFDEFKKAINKNGADQKQLINELQAKFDATVKMMEGALAEWSEIKAIRTKIQAHGNLLAQRHQADVAEQTEKLKVKKENKK